MNKELLQDKMGRPRTQSLFLELGYSEHAVYTLKDEDYDYQGKTYPSIKRMYLESADPTGYTTAKDCLLGWKHWERLRANKIIMKHIKEWEIEMEVCLRSKGVKEAIQHAQCGTFQAAKWLADRGWDKRAAGRPSNEDIEHEKKVQEKISDEFSDDIIRLFK